ncbi:phosphate signaling complex protein PhoU [Kroppenstedtia pulmonis]|uniref:Phosphate-specific transport system accessory protein PhoU n=1 Tax=Kroppenstedtia pulmonis TaxID=1380685 RepID=A0A7D3Y0X4_9BACL|nr:phosphate signaling complex protein PhoU [Kroppenstedtia pulmonis]QKG83963.1 phosphate signaling complex protein PhoU [Kroppenstedtia pulmonis]
MERSFDQSLKEVKELLLGMGEKLEVSIAHAVQSLRKMDESLAQGVTEKDGRIDELEEQIDEKVSALIATRQPVAKDLRKLIAAMKIASDMERMADLSVNIAEITLQLGKANKKPFKELEDIDRMAKLTQRMVHDGINSYIDGNVDLAKELAKIDDQVDQIYESVVTEMLMWMTDRPEDMDVLLRLCFVARYLERIADHATNIAESIVYIETGKRVDLN